MQLCILAERCSQDPQMPQPGWDGRGGGVPPKWEETAGVPRTWLRGVVDYLEICRNNSSQNVIAYSGKS